MQIHIYIPRIIRSFTERAKFLKKIPIKLKILPKDIKDIEDYTNRQVNFAPYHKGQTAIYGDPYKNTGDYAGIKTDIRYYNIVNPDGGGSPGGIETS